MSAIKFDKDKVRLELISEVAEMGLGSVLTFGAKKYASDNWRKGMAWRRVIGAARRHFNAFMRGEDIDEESGLPHIDHLACCVMFLSEYQKLNLGEDDRWIYSRNKKTETGSAPTEKLLQNPLHSDIYVNTSTRPQDSARTTTVQRFSIGEVQAPPNSISANLKALITRARSWLCNSSTTR